MPGSRLQGLTPLLHTRDIPRTIDWYGRVFGFDCVARWQDDWCRLERDGAALMFARNDQCFGDPSATVIQYILVDDTMALFQAVKDQIKTEWGPEVMPYGNLEFAVRDPDGYLLAFGQAPEE